jgi:cyclophilin family peptidyl-prolyl cis-trans isomerase
MRVTNYRQTKYLVTQHIFHTSIAIAIKGRNMPNRTAAIHTTKGTIKFELLESDAPKTTGNFITLAERGYYDGVIFHRVIKGFMIQGGDPTGTGRGGESASGGRFNDEIDSSSALYQRGYKKGTVAMANAGPNTNGSQFFIMHADYPLPPSYTIFGRVTDGLDVVDSIATTQTDPSDKPVSEVKMEKVTIEG